MAEIKGVIIHAWIRLLDDRYGAEAVAGARARMGAADRAVLSTRFLPSSWYPYETLQVLSRLTKQLAKPGEQGLGFEIGRAMAQHACTGVYKSLIVADPAKQLERISWVGDLLFRNLRHSETKVGAGGSGLVRYRYLAGVKPSAGMCTSVAGFLSRILELAGASDVRVRHDKCVKKGAMTCDYLLEWH